MYIISACLCGVNCKYNGFSNINEKCVELFENGNAILVCPEELGGLSTPRLPAEVQGSVSGVLQGYDNIVNNIYENVTLEFLKGAYEVLNIVREKNIHKAILKDGSPSCGVNYIYDGTFNGNKIKGCGVTTYLLLSNGVKVISEVELGG